MAKFETAWIERLRGPHGEHRSPLWIELWQVSDGWRWAIPGVARRFSGVFPTREAAIEEARGLLRTFRALLRITEIEDSARRSHFTQVDLNRIGADAAEFLSVASELPIQTHVTVYPLADANRALGDLRAAPDVAGAVERGRTACQLRECLGTGVGTDLGGAKRLAQDRTCAGACLPFAGAVAGSFPGGSFRQSCRGNSAR